MKIYATISDKTEIFINKHGEREHRTIEGPIVIKDITINNDFENKYSSIQTLYPGSIVRFMKESKAVS
jgi:hypothetical protein